MKQQIKTTEAIFPMPVLLISTYNEDGSIRIPKALQSYMRKDIIKVPEKK